jgi:uncharacterized repeat protein (TIGR04076 family)
MKRTFKESYHFTIRVKKITNDDSQNCRLGFEAGDEFSCEYEVPGKFCPKSMFRAFSLMEVVRADGDLRKLDGGKEKNRMIFTCPDGEVTFELIGEKIN